MGNKKNGTYQKPKPLNPQQRQEQTKLMIKKHLDDARHSGLEYGVVTTMIILAHILYDKTKLKDEEIKEIIHLMGNASESISGEYMTIQDVITVLKEEDDFSISEEKLLEFYPEFEGYFSPKDEKKSEEK